MIVKFQIMDPLFNNKVFNAAPYFLCHMSLQYRLCLAVLYGDQAVKVFLITALASLENAAT